MLLRVLRCARAAQGKLALLHLLFGLSPMHARELVTLQPRLLSFSEERLRGSREVLTRALGVADGHLAMTVMVCPKLLLAAPTTVSLLRPTPSHQTPSATPHPPHKPPSRTCPPLCTSL